MQQKITTNSGRGEASPLLDSIQISEHLSQLGFEKQSNRLKNCSKTSDFFMCGCGVTSRPHRCNYCRLCPVCAEKATYRNVKKYSNVLEKFPLVRNPKEVHRYGLRLLTLTLKNQTDLRSGLKKIKKLFKKLRRRRYCGDRITGGLVSYETTVSSTGLWNIHLHSVLCSKYLSMKHKDGENSPLVNEWMSVTGGEGFISYVELCNSYKGGIKYLLKYVCKPQASLTPKNRAEIFANFYRQKLVYCFGEVPKVKNTKTVCPICHCKYQYISRDSEEYNLFFPEKDKPPTPYNQKLSLYQKES